jgi:uncharacterized membrane protein
MQTFKENLESRKDQNLMSFVLMVCFLMIIFSFLGAFGTEAKSVQNTDSAENIALGNI